MGPLDTLQSDAPGLTSLPQQPMANLAPLPVQAAPVPPPPQQGSPAGSLVGRAFGKVLSGLAGEQNNYSVDPATGKTTVTQTKTPPGQWARGVLAAGLLGDAGIDPKHGQMTFTQGLLSGLTGGTRAAQEQSKEADQQKRQQAQQEYANQLKANEEARQNKELDLREQLNKASIANYTANTMATNYKLMQAHQENQMLGAKSLVERDAPWVEMYKQTNTAPVAEALNAAAYQKLLEDNSKAINAHTVIPVVTGLDPVIHDDNSISWEPIGALYPVASKFTDNTLAELKSAGIAETDPLYKEVSEDVKNGTPVEPRKMLSIQSEINRRFDYAEKQQKIASEQASAAREYAEANEARIRARLDQLNLKNAESVQNGKLLFSAIGDSNGIQVGKRKIIIPTTPDGKYDFKSLTPEDKVNLRDYLGVLDEQAQNDFDKVLNASRANPDDKEVRQKVKDAAGTVSSFSNILNSLTGRNDWPGGNNPSNQISNLARTYGYGLQGDAAALFSGFTAGIIQGKPLTLSQMLEGTQKAALTPEDKQAVSAALEKFYAGAAPILQKNNQINQKLQQQIQTQRKLENNPGPTTLPLTPIATL